MSKQHKGRISRLYSATCILALALFGLISAAMAAKPVATTAPNSLSGEWEAVRYSLRSDVRMQHAKPNDLGVLWDRMTIGILGFGVGFADESFACTLGPNLRNVGLPLRTLFRGERVKRPAWIKLPIGGKLSEYSDLEPYRHLPIALYQFECEESLSKDDSTRWPERGTNWLAWVGDTLWVPDGDAVIIYKRPPKTREPKHVAYCEAAKTPVELAICAERRLWQYHRYVMAAYRVALVDEPKRTQELAASRVQFEKQLNACKTDSACLHLVLRDTISTFVDKYHPQWCSGSTYIAPVYSFKKTDGMGCIRGDVD